MARRRPPTVHGVCIVDKPAGMTSHDVVGQLRKRFSERQIGHAGTLDPDATGVLVVAVGMATRLLQFATASTKTYTGEAVLGVETSTLDAAGEVVATHDMSAVTLTDVERVVAKHLIGEIDQIPPMVSAIKIDGKRLHELAREGIEVERKPRRVTVSRCDVATTSEPNVFSLHVECSAGTYIRTIADDIGHLLGGGAHLATFAASPQGHSALTDLRLLSIVNCCRLKRLPRALSGLMFRLRLPSGWRSAGCCLSGVDSDRGPSLLTVCLSRCTSRFVAVMRNLRWCFQRHLSDRFPQRARHSFVS